MIIKTNTEPAYFVFKPFLVLHMSLSITVRFLRKEALYVAPGRTLVLEAQFELQKNEKILFRTWERKNSDGEVRLAEDDKANNNRTFVEKNGALLRINRVENSDFGLYKVTVTAATGEQASDLRQVIKISKWLEGFHFMIMCHGCV